MRDRHEEWLGRLAVSLWVRVVDDRAGFGLADEWVSRVAAVMDEVVRRTAPSISRLLPGMEGADGIEPVALPAVVRLLQSVGRGGSIRSVDLRPGDSIVDAAQQARDPVGGAIAWILGPDQTVRLRYRVDGLPTDPGTPVAGREVQLSCELSPLPHAERAAIWSIAQDLAVDVDLIYGQVGVDESGGTVLEAEHPRRLGPNQGWRLTRLRGYDWMTFVPPALASQIGEEHLAYGRSHLYLVEACPNGGLRLQATQTPETYTMEAVTHLFRTVPQILPGGAPQRRPEIPFAPVPPHRMLCYADPALFR